MKKIISLALALLMIFSLVSTAFAAEGDPVITVPDDGHSYEIYQIFTATLVEKDGITITPITVTNEYKMYELPKTGGFGTEPIYVLGILLILFCGVYLLLDAQKRNRRVS